ncbi:MAG: SpoIVB peptidase S55 domain-containing protein [Eubacteriales bacterium]|nr:SpoIVB peptidase S55 domain-containing protein [Eubacteriales bacterium]
MTITHTRQSNHPEQKTGGTVTHLLANDPTRGYVIFIENMLDAAKDN